MRVLVVDDEPQIVARLQAALRRKIGPRHVRTDPGVGYRFMES
jgi:DNA-binding response OmpR family regulator